MRTEKPENAGKNELSLHPLDLETALAAVLKTGGRPRTEAAKPSKKPARKHVKRLEHTTNIYGF
jgi:hypothetical protein